MFGSQNAENNVVLAIYSDNRTVFRLNDIAMITGEINFQSLNKKLNYYVRKNKLLNPRKGIYAKPGYNKEELACSVYAPSYISLEYVLQKGGIVFQYDTRITVVSYLSRSIEIEKRTYSFRKIKGEILGNTTGILRQPNHVNIACPERAFIDTLYLDKEYFFDNLNLLNKEIIVKLLPLYRSKELDRRVLKLIQNG